MRHSRVVDRIGGQGRPNRRAPALSSSSRSSSASIHCALQFALHWVIHGAIHGVIRRALHCALASAFTLLPKSSLASAMAASIAPCMFFTNHCPPRAISGYAWPTRGACPCIDPPARKLNRDRGYTAPQRTAGHASVETLGSGRPARKAPVPGKTGWDGLPLLYFFEERTRLLYNRCHCHAPIAGSVAFIVLRAVGHCRQDRAGHFNSNKSSGFITPTTRP